MRGLIGAALCLLAAAPAHAGVVVGAGVPFTAAQLEAAIAARGGGPGGDLAISRTGPDRLELVTPAGRWQIDIGDASGETAARVVALHVVELATAPAAPPAAPPVVAAAPGETPPADEAAARAPATPSGYRLAVLGVGSRGVRAGDFASVGGAVEVARTGRWIAGGGIAWQRGLTIEREGGLPIDADLLRARVFAGVALGPAELVAGAFAGRFTVDGGSEVIGAWTTGLAAEARVAVPVLGPWSVFFAAGAEVYRHRIEVRLDGATLGATPRAALGGAIGLAFTGGPR